MSDSEKLLPLATAVQEATGQRPHPSTLHRWRLRGIAGVRLATVRLGGRRMATVAAVRQFLDGVTAAADGEQPAPRTPRQRERDVDSAERELDRAGI